MMPKSVWLTAAAILLGAGTVLWTAGPSSTDAQTPSKRKAKKDPPPAPPAAAVDDGISVYFSPNGHCTEAIVREIETARQTVYVQAAQFTSIPIAKALIGAQKRGVEVKVVLDSKKDDQGKAQLDRLLNAEVPTYADGRHSTAHNKVIVIDHAVVITGSFNLTPDAESENAENLLVIRDKPALAAAYEANFKEHLSHSNPSTK